MYMIPVLAKDRAGFIGYALETWLTSRTIP